MYIIQIDPHIVPVSRWRYLEHRYMANVCERWAQDRAPGLQSAFFNGVGYETWQNIWGTWNEISQRDAEAIRRVGAMLRFLGALFGGGPTFGAVEFEPVNRSDLTFGFFLLFFSHLNFSFIGCLVNLKF